MFVIDGVEMFLLTMLKSIFLRNRNYYLFTSIYNIERAFYFSSYLICFEIINLFFKDIFKYVFISILIYVLA